MTNKFTMRFLMAALLAGSALAPSLRAITTYRVDNTGGTCISSRTIHASDSGMTSAHYAVTVYNAISRIPTSHYSATINASTYDLSLSFPSTYFPTGYCGLIKLRGMYGGSDTSNANDFVVGVSGTANITVSVQGSYSQRTVNGVTYASDVSSGSAVYLSPDCVSETFVYFAPGTGQLTFANNVDSSCLSNFDLVHGANTYGTAFPTGSVPLGRVSSDGTQVIMDGDFRPWR
jgi:hypothetical protein